MLISTCVLQESTYDSVVAHQAWIQSCTSPMLYHLGLFIKLPLKKKQKNNMGSDSGGFIERAKYKQTSQHSVDSSNSVARIMLATKLTSFYQPFYSSPVRSENCIDARSVLRPLWIITATQSLMQKLLYKMNSNTTTHTTLPFTMSVSCWACMSFFLYVFISPFLNVTVEHRAAQEGTISQRRHLKDNALQLTLVSQ